MTVKLSTSYCKGLFVKSFQLHTYLTSTGEDDSASTVKDCLPLSCPHPPIPPPSQVKVLELESQLENERLRLGELRKKHYEIAGVPLDQLSEGNGDVTVGPNSSTMSSKHSKPALAKKPALAQKPNLAPKVVVSF